MGSFEFNSRAEKFDLLNIVRLVSSLEWVLKDVFKIWH
jgi:hypothetical protein